MSYVGDTVLRGEPSPSTTAEVDSSINWTLGTNINVLDLKGTIALSGTANSTGHDILSGNSGNDILTDSGSSNSLNSDTMTGNSTVIGGGDTFVVSNASDTILESGSTAAALIKSGVSFDLTGTNVTKLTLTGAGNVSGTGDGTAGGDSIIGNSGNDTLSDNNNGGAGDTLAGHSSHGGDMFIVTNSGDVISEAGNIGGAFNTIQTTLGGTAFDSLTGSFCNLLQP